MGNGQDAVEVALSCSNVGGGSTKVSWVLDEVIASGEADAFGFYLLWSYLERMRRWVAARRTAGRAL